MLVLVCPLVGTRKASLALSDPLILNEMLSLAERSCARLALADVLAAMLALNDALVLADVLSLRN